MSEPDNRRHDTKLVETPHQRGEETLSPELEKNPRDSKTKRRRQQAQATRASTQRFTRPTAIGLTASSAALLFPCIAKATPSIIKDPDASR